MCATGFESAEARAANPLLGEILRMRRVERHDEIGHELGVLGHPLGIVIGVRHNGNQVIARRPGYDTRIVHRPQIAVF